MDKLEVSFGTDVKQGVRNIKRLEAGRLKHDNDQTHRETCPLSDFGID
jgi:hypothetical protein